MKRRNLASLFLFIVFHSPPSMHAAELDEKVLLDMIRSDSNLPFVDLDGDEIVSPTDLFILAISWKAQFPELSSTSPADNEEGVAITRETVLRFTSPLKESSLTNESIVAIFGGKTLSARKHLSRDRKTLTLFYDSDLPASARVRVRIDGDQMLDENSIPVDVDGDGRVGGVKEVNFNTLSLTVVPGTSVFGRVFASELVPGAGTSINVPLAGVMITVDGREDTLKTTTDSMGNFLLDPCPAGRFFVHIDGRTATNGVPEGAYYPFVGKAWKSTPGQSTNIGEVYLPLVRPNTLQPVSATQETIIGFPEEVLADYPELAGVFLNVPPGALFSDDGTIGGMVGIAPVPPDRLPGTLPEGLDFPIVITVQTDGPTNFDIPVPVCFPNLDGLPAGSKTALWSFNHDTGRFEVVGPMTVSEDGQTICTDPGVGILAPGWHGTGPGSPGGGGDGPYGDGPPGCTYGCSPDSQSCPPCGNPGAPGPPDGEGSGGNPVYLATGEKYEMVTDLTIKGRGMDFIWRRRYASREGRLTSMGHNWDVNYNIQIEPSGRLMKLKHGNSQDDMLHQRPDGTFSRREFFMTLEEVSEKTFSMRFPHQGGIMFNPCDESLSAGMVQEIFDRNGNSIQFLYDDLGRLIEIIDTLDRSIMVSYNSNGFIAGITDFIGRQVTYEYYQDGDVGGGFGDIK